MIHGFSSFWMPFTSFPYLDATVNTNFFLRYIIVLSAPEKFHWLMKLYHYRFEIILILQIVVLQLCVVPCLQWIFFPSPNLWGNTFCQNYLCYFNPPWWYPNKAIIIVRCPMIVFDRPSICFLNWWYVPAWKNFLIMPK